MATREEIREGIVDWFLARDPSKDRAWAEWETKMLFFKLDRMGVVVKVDLKDKSLDELDFSAVEPLIGKEL